MFYTYIMPPPPLPHSDKKHDAYKFEKERV
jgi:hypothetical protein